MRGFLLLPLILLHVSCGIHPQTADSEISYRDALLETIHRSDTIRITEHSHPADAPDREKSKHLEKHERIHRQVDLSPEATSRLTRVIGSLSANGSDIRTRCEFVDHHSIRFLRNGRTTSTLRICFQCGDIVWDGSDRFPPLHLLDRLHRFLISQGFQPERDWKALAG